MPITTCVFDAYGTLFNVTSAAKKASEEMGQEALKSCWQSLANDWRLKQLQYTWLRATMDRHADFWEITQNGLDFALENNRLNGDVELRERLLSLYWELAAYPEVPAILAALKQADLTSAILSNGSPEMLQGAVESANIGDMLDAVLSVETVGVFKPHRRVYQMVLDHFKCDPNEVLFVSSNGWDIAGASEFGFQTVWVNRANDPVDRLPWLPKHVVSDLTSIPHLVTDR